MIVTTLSPKHQTTVPIEIVKQLGLVAGMRLKQWVEGNRIILEPIPDIMESFGVFSKPDGVSALTPLEENELMELAVARDVMAKSGVRVD